MEPVITTQSFRNLSPMMISRIQILAMMETIFLPPPPMAQSTNMPAIVCPVILATTTMAPLICVCCAGILSLDAASVPTRINAHSASRVILSILAPACAICAMFQCQAAIPAMIRQTVHHVFLDTILILELSSAQVALEH